VSYCANQVYVKSLLDTKKLDPAIDDFLHRCQESPFSRRLDLWSFLGLYTQHAMHCDCLYVFVACVCEFSNL